MKEVAQTAGVSVATVSHVLNKTRYVSPELAQRVLDSAAKLGYTPHGPARSLRIRATQTIGLILPDINPFFAELARVIEDQGFAAGYTTVLGNADDVPERERKYVEALVSKRVDGLILASTLLNARMFERVAGSPGAPVVLVDREGDFPGVDVVLADNEGGGYAATSHLIALGHRRIGCIAGPSAATPSGDRTKGYRRALAEAGIVPEDSWTVAGDFRYAGGRRATAELLERRLGLTAIFAANDLMAIGAINELGARGLKVPADVSVVGYDDTFPAAVVAPALTTIHQPLVEMGVTAVELLLARIRGESPSEAERRVLPTRLVIRESTAGPPAEREAA